MTNRTSFFNSVFKTPIVARPKEFGSASFDGFNNIDYLEKNKKEVSEFRVVETVKEKEENNYLFTEKDIIKRQKKITPTDFPLNQSDVRNPAPSDASSPFPKGDYTTIKETKVVVPASLDAGLNFTSVPRDDVISGNFSEDGFSISDFEKAIEAETKKAKEAPKEEKPSFEEYSEQSVEISAIEYGHPDYDVLQINDNLETNDTDGKEMLSFFKSKRNDAVSNVDPILKTDEQPALGGAPSPIIAQEDFTASDEDKLVENSDEGNISEESLCVEDEAASDDIEIDNSNELADVDETPLEEKTSIQEGRELGQEDFEDNSFSMGNLEKSLLNSVFDNAGDEAKVVSNMRPEQKKAWKDFSAKLFELIGQ